MMDAGHGSPGEPRILGLCAHDLGRDVAGTVIGLGTVLALFYVLRQLPNRGIARKLNGALNTAIGSSPTR